MAKWKCFSLLVMLMLAVQLVFVGCSGMGTDPSLPVPLPGVLNPEATPIEIPGPETEESSEDQDSPEATPIEIPVGVLPIPIPEGETEEDPYEIPVEETEEDPYPALPIPTPDATPTEEPEKEADIL